MQDRRSLRLTAGVVKFGLHFVESLALFDYGFGIGLRLDSAALLVAIFAAEAEKVETSQNISQRDTIRMRFEYEWAVGTPSTPGSQPASPSTLRTSRHLPKALEKLRDGSCS